MAFIKKLLSSILILTFIEGILPSDVVTDETIDFDIVVESYQSEEDLPHGW